MKNFIKSHWRLLLVVTVFAVVAIVFFNILWGDPNLASAIVAFGTLTLALVTGLHIVNSNEQEKHRRKERLLNEIIEWAIEVAKCGIERHTPELEVEDVGDDEAFSFVSSQYNKLDILQLLRARSEYTKEIAQKICPTLREAVNEVTNNLRNQLRILFGFKIDPNPIGIIREVIKNNEQLYTSAVKVIQEAAKIKTKEI